jgi:Fic family protein
MERLTQLKKKVDQFRPIPPEVMETIDQKFKIEWTYNSNAIEGNTMTLQETVFFLQEGLTSKGKTLKDYLEAQNHVEAIDYLKDIVRQNRPISESLIKELNALLLKGIDTVWIGPQNHRIQKQIHPGKYKTQPNHVITLDGEVHHYCDPIRVPFEMEKLVRLIVDNEETLHPVELAAKAHHRFVAIHPFDDGNGRAARLLMNLILIRAGYPPVVIKNEAREKYYQALMEADQGDDSKIIHLVQEEAKNSLELMLDILENRKNTPK